MSHHLNYPCNVSYAEYKRQCAEHASIREQTPAFSDSSEAGNLRQNSPLVRSEGFQTEVPETTAEISETTGAGTRTDHLDCRKKRSN